MGKLKSQKPEPPADLHERMAEVLNQYRELSAPVRPPGGFTRQEYQECNGITMGTANRQLQVLQKAGKVKKIGSPPMCFYVTT